MQVALFEPHLVCALKQPARCSQGATRVVQISFPGVRERFLRAAAWHLERHSITPEFGLFWNLCINAAFPEPSGSKPSIRCLPHVDSRNGISVCVLFIYLLPNCECYDDSNQSSKSAEFDTGHFDDTRRVWLVVWELGVVVQLPPWTYCAYPSSLLYHFNIDVEGERCLPSNP
jgi:hypothetical protein